MASTSEPIGWLIADIVCYAIYTMLFSMSVCLVYKQRKFNHKMFMKKRSLSLYYSLNISIIGSMAGTILIFSAFIRFSVIQQMIMCSIGAFFVFNFLYLMLVKNWMIYYKYKWTYYTIQLKWSHIINSRNASTEAKKNWFINNNKKYGNLSYIYKLLAIYVIIAYLFCSIFISLLVYFEFHLLVLGI